MIKIAKKSVSEYILDMDKGLFPRTKYLDRIRPFYDDSEMIKVLTGVRRCGKSSLMETVQDDLREKGVENIVSINLDKRPYMKISCGEELDQLIESKCRDMEGMIYLFIDEIQNAEGFEKCINAYREEGNYSIFITGSNSYLLSGELVTKLTGRYIEFEITTLTFDEYVEMKRWYGKKVDANPDRELNNYILEGGFPKSIRYETLAEKRIYVESVVSEIFEKDVDHSKRIRKKALFDSIMQFIINNFGSTMSIKELCSYLSRTRNESIRKETVYRYIKELENLKIVSKCSRFDLKSKRSLNGEEKYYLSDLSFYFLRNADNRIPYGPVLENIVYQYAKSIGYKISIGRIGRLDVDFILRDINLSYAYIQVARTIDNGNIDDNGVNLTEEREYRSLEAIRDNYPKYVLTEDSLLQRRNGIIHENLAEFILAHKEF